MRSMAAISTEASGEAFPWSGVELFDKSRGSTGRQSKHVTCTYVPNMHILSGTQIVSF